ncbi:MAG: LacI family DNA-binding transcriptional regulator [Nitriliruptoraceae bacterium]
MPGQPTMSDVARLAGVDSSTVSRALNSRTATSLRPETVAKVLAASEQLGYRPNVLARGLRTQRTHTVGLLLPDVTNPFFPPIIRGIEDALIPTGHVLLIANTDNEPEREEQGLDSLVARQVDGVMLATSHLDVATDADRLGGIPTVLVNRRDRASQVPAVLPDDVKGVRLVVDHLHGLGHRRIALVSGPLDTSTGRDRRDTFVAACRDLGLPTDHVVHADRYDLPSGRRAAEVLLEAEGPAPTAVFASNDLLAVGALTALRARGLRVPDDVSLVGYNDMPLVDLLDPALTTVRIDQYLMGRRAAEVMLELLERSRSEGSGDGDIATVADVTIVPELVVRRSTGTPPGTA